MNVPAPVRRSARRRRLALSLTLALTLLLSACGSSGDGGDVTELRDEISSLREEIDQRFENIDQRFTALEAEQGVDDQVAPDDPADQELTGDDVMGDIDSFIGEPVTVTAEVGQVIDEATFTLTSSAGSLLVVASAADTTLVEEGARVRTSGTIAESFSVAAASGSTESAALAEFEGQPYLAAEVIGEPVNAPSTSESEGA